MKNTLNEKPNDDLYGYRQEALRLVKTSNITNKTILDIGCGFGWCELRFSKLKAKKIYGIDVSRENIIQAKKRNIKNSVFIQGDAIKLPFKNKIFDTVVSWEVLEHIPVNTEKQFFSEVYRVLKQGGYFFLSTPNKNILSTPFDPAWWLIGHRNYFKDEVVKFALASKFKVEKIYTKGRFWSVSYALNMYISKWVFRRRPFLNDFFYSKNIDEYLKGDGYVSIFTMLRKK